eukprot:m51a1_g1796 putative serine threonine kinase (1102) ;mRNA; f:418404-422879
MSPLGASVVCAVALVVAASAAAADAAVASTSSSSSGSYLGVERVGTQTWSSDIKSPVAWPAALTQLTCWSFPITLPSGNATTTIGDLVFDRGYIVLSNSGLVADPCSGGLGTRVAGNFTNSSYALAFPRTTCAGSRAPLLSVDGFAARIAKMGSAPEVAAVTSNGISAMFIEFHEQVLNKTTGDLSPKFVILVAADAVYFNYMKFKPGTATSPRGLHVGARGAFGTIDVLCDSATNASLFGPNNSYVAVGDTYRFGMFTPGGTSSSSGNLALAEDAVPKGPIIGGALAAWGPIPVPHATLVQEDAEMGNKEGFVDPHYIKMVRELGRGDRGVAYLANWHGTEVVAKSYKFATSTSQSEKRFHATVTELKALRHVNVQMFICFSRTPTDLILVTEYLANKSLRDFLSSSKRISFPRRFEILRGIAKGMAYLHCRAPQIVHGHLTSSNILLAGNLTVKVCDFEFSRIVKCNSGAEEASGSAVGSVLWTAPENLAGAAPTTKSDVYSFGILTWEVVTRQTPFSNANVHTVPQLVLSNIRPRIDEEVWKGLDPLSQLMHQCWSANSQERPEFTHIIAQWGIMKSKMDNSLVDLESIDPPKGHVTIVFTGEEHLMGDNIMGSSELWSWDAEVARQTVLTHNETIRQSLAKHKGFESAIQALMFCCDAQKALLEAKWDPRILNLEPFSIEKKGETLLYRGCRVRMGLNAGAPEVEVSDNGSADYFGPCVNKAARVAHKGEGGQIVMSTAVRDELDADPSRWASLGEFRELGSVALKGIRGEEVLHEFVVGSIPREFKNYTSDNVLPGAANSGGTISHGARDESIMDFFKVVSAGDKPLWAVDPKSVTISDAEVGRGSFGCVFKGEWRNQVVAIKKCFPLPASARESFQRHMQELAQLADLRHPSVVLFMGANVDPDDLWIITEWMDHGSLRDVLELQAIQMPQAVEVLSSVCHGLVYLHNTGIIHRDLRASNVLVNKKWDVKLSDFGLPLLKALNQNKSGSRNVAWMAPEALSDNAFTDRTDVYSFGMVMYEVIIRDVPFKGVNAMTVVSTILAGGRPEVPDSIVATTGFSDHYVDLMRSCWAHHPKERPKVTAMLEAMVRMASTKG